MTLPNLSGSQKDLVINYLFLRRSVGVLGIFLPILLVIGTWVKAGKFFIHPSISHYYSSNMGDVFVGMLCAVALFLFSYKGYNDKTSKDNFVTTAASICGVGIAIFPHESENNKWVGMLHYGFAATFFLILAFISIRLFTRQSTVKSKINWTKENTLYVVCGVTILTCILLIAIYQVYKSKSGGTTPIDKLRPVFWLETIALWAFGVSWLTKGKWEGTKMLFRV